MRPVASSVSDSTAGARGSTPVGVGRSSSPVGSAGPYGTVSARALVSGSGAGVLSWPGPVLRRRPGRRRDASRENVGPTGLLLAAGGRSSGAPDRYRSGAIGGPSDPARSVLPRDGPAGRAGVAVAGELAPVRWMGCAVPVCAACVCAPGGAPGLGPAVGLSAPRGGRVGASRSSTRLNRDLGASGLATDSAGVGAPVGCLVKCSSITGFPAVTEGAGAFARRTVSITGGESGAAAGPAAGA
jgi:hypothetical protein